MKEKIYLWIIKTFFREEVINMINLTRGNKVEESLEDGDISQFDIKVFKYISGHDIMFYVYLNSMLSAMAMTDYYNKEEPECLKAKLNRITQIDIWEKEEHREYKNLINYAENM